jgi:putative membrane protein
MRHHLGLRAVALLGAAATTLASGTGAGASVRATAPRIDNRETVQADLNPDGSVKVARLFSQLVLDGDGVVHVVDPTSTKDLRDLDGFSKPGTENGAAVWDVDVSGRAVRRTVASFPKGSLPVDVSVTYELNGRPVKARDVVGRSGTLRVTYHVRNTTAKPTRVSYVDGKGATRTATVDVPTPLVGQLQTTLPGRFASLDAPRADVAGDGRGGNLLTWTMVLFSPIGELEQEFGWTARISDGVVPKVAVQIVPVPPKRKPELKFGEDGFASGAEQAGELTAGAGEIDANVLKLRDGAAELLDGLTQLAAGAADLKAGLAGEAAPGADQLAGGLDQAAAGGSDLANGLVELAGGAGLVSNGLHAANDGGQQLLDGSQDLAAGAGFVSTGARQVANGLGSLDSGLAQLSESVSGLKTNAGFLALKAGVALVAGAIGVASPASPPVTPVTVLDALNAVAAGLTQLGTSHSAGLPAVVDGVSALKAGLGNAKTAIATMAAAMAQQQALLADALVQAACAATPGIPLCVDVATAAGIAAAVSDGLTNPSPLLGLGAGVDAALAGIGSSATPAPTILYGLATAVAGIGSTSTPGTLLYGLNRAILGLDHPAGAAGPSDPGGVKQGVLAIGQGIDLLVDGIVAAVTGAIGTPSTSPATTLRGGVAALSGGADQVAGGAAQVADGAGLLSLGALDLADGVDQLDDGATDLAAGADEASTGADQLLDGLDRLKDGSHDLAGGLGDAADGAGKIADGLGKAKDGGGRLTDGAGRLSKEGTSVLVKAGNKTAADSALSLARLKALDEKAATGGLPYGAPAGGTGSAAYLLTLAAADAQGTEDAGRGLLAVGLLVAASAAGTLVRRRAASR